MTLTSEDIAAIAAAFAEGSLEELHLTGPGADLHLRRSTSTDTPSVASLPGPATIAAPCVGVFLPRHPLRTEPFAAPGCRAHAGEVVALLRIGLLLRQVAAPTGGIIGAVLVEEGATVGFGTALFSFHPDPPEVQR